MENMEPIYLDQDGYNEYLKNIEKLKKAIQENNMGRKEAFDAGAGDGWDSPEFEEIERINMRLSGELRNMYESLNRIVIIEKHNDQEIVDIGDVIVADMIFSPDDMEEMTFKLVGASGDFNAEIQEISINSPLGNISYGALFLTTDIISEKYGRSSATEATNLSFVFMILFTILMHLFLQYTPCNSDFSQNAFETIFSFIPRITLGSLTAYCFSQRCDAYLYEKLKKKYNKVWISNNVSTIISQVLDTTIFVLIAFVGTMKLNEIISLMITMIIFKWIIAILDTPFMMITTKIKNNMELE